MKRFLTQSELADLCVEVLNKEGLTQMQAASRLGVSQSHVSRACNYDPDVAQLTGLRLRILREIGGLSVSDHPFYQVSKSKVKA